VLTPPVFLLLLGLQLATGALVAASFQDSCLLFGPAVLGTFVCAYLHLSCRRQWTFRKLVISIVLFFLLLLAPFCGYSHAQSRLPAVGADDLCHAAGKITEIEAQVRSVLPLKSGKRARFFCSILYLRKGRGASAETCSGTTLLMVRADSPLARILSRRLRFRCNGLVQRLERLEQQGKEGYANYLRRQGVTSICYVKGDYFELVAAPGLPANGTQSLLSLPDTVEEHVEKVRARLIEAHVENLGRQTGTLLTAMVLGERAVGLDPELLNSFRNVGLSHILAASGFNLTVVTFSIHWMCRVLSVPTIPANCLCFAMMLVFVMFAGNSASVVRASLMCAFALAANSLARRLHVCGLLGVALLISVLADPLSVADPGFQLSYAALAGIVFIVSPLSAFLKAIACKSWLVWILEILFTVIAAQACVLPLQLYYFKQIGLLFLPANLLASLLVSPITVAGFASSFVLIFSPGGNLFQPVLLFLARALDWLSFLPLQFLIQSVQCLSACSWALVKTAPIAVWHALLYYLLLFILCVHCLERLKIIEKKIACSKSRSVSSEVACGPQI